MHPARGRAQGAATIYMSKQTISESAAQLGRQGLGKPKRNMTAADRERRREWARGLAARRAATKQQTQETKG